MAAKKVYAVKKGKRPGIYDNWDACKAAVEGFSGAEYKGFATMKEACEYLGITPEEVGGENPVLAETGGVTVAGSGKVSAKGKQPPREGNQPQDTLIAYVDGSYEHSILKYAFGCVFLLPDGTIYVENGSGNNTDSAKLRNVTGEMLGSMFAVRWAIKNGFPKLEIRYDYEGVEKWVTGDWKSKTELTQKYAEAMRRWSSQVQIRFTKVAAHTNVYYNEMADQLAKQALVEKDGVPEIRKKEEMEPWKAQNWRLSI